MDQCQCWRSLPLRGVEGIETRMVGREAELKHLQDAFHTAREDIELQVVTVTGEAGVGKSRLLHEFDIWAEARLDRLPPESRTVLQQASVVGRLFWDRAVARIHESTGEGIEQGRLYGKADRMLIEEAIVVPLGNMREYVLIKPWVSRYPTAPFRRVFWQDVVLEPH